jgi:plasmid stabilization system protein ParE
MRRRVILGQRALADLRDIGNWIADHASETVAERYVWRLRSYCEGFDVFSERGTRRDDLRPGLRTIGFERRVTVAFAVFEDEVLIIRLFYGGRDIEAAFAADDDEFD